MHPDAVIPWQPKAHNARITGLEHEHRQFEFCFSCISCISWLIKENGILNHEIHKTHERKTAMGNIIHKLESYEVMGACFEVYKEKGSGFLESVYQECLEIELGDRQVPFIVHSPLVLTYKGRPLKCTFTPDFICYDKIVIELKAVSGLTDEHRAQVHNYLRATKMKLGLLVNFGHYPKLEYERIVL